MISGRYNDYLDVHLFGVWGCGGDNDEFSSEYICSTALSTYAGCCSVSSIMQLMKGGATEIQIPQHINRYIGEKFSSSSK
jgi:hypothetical protein